MRKLWLARHREEVNEMRYICAGLSFWLTLTVTFSHATTYVIK